jgi:toxin-antitoxin system PIN domain toxin
MPDIDLPDVNVWLALTCEDHQHHRRARRYWEGESAPRLAFCRVTMLGLLRLSTHPKVMQNRPFTAGEAWKIYRAFTALPEVLFLAESTGIEAQFAAYSETAAFPANRWTDAYIAAAAHDTGCRLVSFDADFHHFPDLDFLHLKALP